MVSSKSAGAHGLGLGLRPQHYSNLSTQSELPVLEILADNLLGHRGGPALSNTDSLAARTPVCLHSVGLGIGGESLDPEYLRLLRILIARYQPLVTSDHLCFTRSAHAASYELLPLPRTENVLRRVCAHVNYVQEYFARQLCLENVSAYVDYRHADYTEGEFFSELVKRTGCGVLLDTNNLFVNAYNFDFDPYVELRRYPLHAVQQLHVAGHRQIREPSSYLFDTHDQPVCQEVLALTQEALTLTTAQPFVILEWDDPQTDFPTLHAQYREVEAALKRDRETHRPQQAVENRERGCRGLEREKGCGERGTPSLPQAAARNFSEVPASEPPQAQFVSFLHSLAFPDKYPYLLRELTPRYSHRIATYRDSFRGRVIGTLSTTVLAYVCETFGAETVQNILARYFLHRPPQEILITDSLRELPAFIRRLGAKTGAGVEAEDGATLMAQLTELALATWDLLSAPDPEPLPPAPSGSLEARIPLPAKTLMFPEGKGVLLLKTSSALTTSIPLSLSLLPFAENLAQGHTLLEALHLLPESADIPQSEFQDFLLALHSQNCLRAIPPRDTVAPTKNINCF